MSFFVDVVRPGAARSRREAEIWVSYTRCGRCGGQIYTQGRGGVEQEGDAVWEVLGRCRACQSVQRALFLAGPGWTDGRDTPDDFFAVGNGRGPMPLMAAGRTPSAILGPDQLLRMRDAELAALQRDCPLDGPDLVDDDDWGNTASHYARDVLEALYEMDLQADAGRMTLPPDHASLKAKVERIYQASGGPLPPR